MVLPMKRSCDGTKTDGDVISEKTELGVAEYSTATVSKTALQMQHVSWMDVGWEDYYIGSDSPS
jgi:hypothetical protein